MAKLRRHPGINTHFWLSWHSRDIIVSWTLVYIYCLVAWWKEMLNAVSKASFTLRQWNWKRRFQSGWKRVKCSHSTTDTLGKFWNATTTSHLDFCLSKTRGEKSRDYGDVIVYEKLRKAVVLKFLLFKEHFRKWKALFSRRISVDGRANDKYKAAFWNFSVWDGALSSSLPTLAIQILH